MLINHQSEFQSAMQDLEYLGYDLDTVAPNSRYTLKDIILNLVTEYQTVAYEEGMADGHAAGYDLGEEEGVTYGRDVGYEEGYDAGKEDGDAEGYDRGYEEGYEEAWDEVRAGPDL